MAASDEFSRPPASHVMMPFIVSLDVGKADPATRKLIRSHARRGKFKKRGRPAEDHRGSGRITMTGSTQASQVLLEDVITLYTPLLPGRIGSNLYFVEFTDEIETSTLLKMAKVSTVAGRIVFPLKAAIGFSADSTEWNSPFGLDIATLHITAFAVQGFIDKVLRREGSLNPAAIRHLQKGLTILRGRLLGDDDDIKISDSTIGVVLKLASTAHFDGDYQVSKQHIEGLRKMIDLRGGLGVLRGKRLLAEVLRCDLGIALLNRSNPAFFSQPSEPVFEYPEKLMSAPEEKMCAQDDLEVIDISDDKLATAWRVMRRFCLLVNLGAQTQRVMPPDLIYDTMAAVMYRLLNMGFDAGSVNEAVRYGLLAFCYHIFLQWQDIKPPYCNFLVGYQNCLLGLTRTNQVSSQLMLWLSTIGAISVFELSGESWLRELVQEHAARCQVKTLKKMQAILKTFLWIGLLDELAGSRVYDSLPPHHR
ncbi:hypothetical protein GGR54DRAFT_625575 [Hypoxylon sp. NC1633]|nr:hypothetical protein GGR54DRAFT_625575 [Hypoxylon sp. NC1633]